MISPNTSAPSSPDRSRPAMTCAIASAMRIDSPIQEVCEDSLPLAGHDRLRVKLYALERRIGAREVAMANPHDLVLPGLRRDLETGRQRVALDEQRVVAGGLERV